MCLLRRWFTGFLAYCFIVMLTKCSLNLKYCINIPYINSSIVSHKHVCLKYLANLMMVSRFHVSHPPAAEHYSLSQVPGVHHIIGPHAGCPGTVGGEGGPPVKYPCIMCVLINGQQRKLLAK